MSIFLYLTIISFLCIGSAISADCPMGCPDGWVRFGYSDHCYKLPDQPAVLDTFANHQRRCAQLDPTAYVAVTNSLREQAFATAVAGEYGSLWTSTAPSAFVWLGLQADAKGWKASDGSDISQNFLLIAANVSGPQKPDTCLGADPESLGSWKARPCSEKGIVICEMPKRSVCGKAGQILPTIPVNIFDISRFGLLFPNSKIPFLDKIFNAAILDIAVSDASMVDVFKAPAPDCRYDCPPGWMSLSRGPTAPCYLLPNASEPDVPNLSIWAAKCQKAYKGANVSMVNGLVELSMWMAILNSLAPKSPQQNITRIILQNRIPTKFNYQSASDDKSSLITALENSGESGQDRSSGSPKRINQTEKVALAVCEMPKSLICGNSPRGNVLDWPLEEFTVQRLATLFPRSPKIPFLAEVLDGQSSNAFNPFEAEKNEKSKAKYGDAAVAIVCIRKHKVPEHSLGFSPSIDSLVIYNDQLNIVGQWAQIKCKSGPIDAFKLDLISYVSAWSRCYSNGYEVAVPWDVKNSNWGRWSPFLIGDSLAEYYRKDGEPDRPIDKHTTYSKVPMMKIDQC